MPSGFFVWETIRCRLDAFLWYAMHTSKEGFSLPKILIVEDELPIADLIRLTLKSAGYLCDHAPDGDQAADLAAAGNYDLALVDVMLPRTDGFTLLEYFQSLELPVIFVTARSAVADRVKGLKLGAEDYIVKPFDVAELLARVETVLRRFHKTEETLSLAGVRVDPRARKVWRGEEEVSLTPKEYDLLLLFLHNPNAALYRDTIYERFRRNFIGASPDGSRSCSQPAAPFPSPLFSADAGRAGPRFCCRRPVLRPRPVPCAWSAWSLSSSALAAVR